MNKPYLAQCREAIYDEQDEMLVLLCFFQDFGESRIVCFPRSDFHYKHPGNEVPHIEMHRTAEAWKGKPFHLVIGNDPNRNKDAEEHPVVLTEDFRKKIGQQLEEVSDGLSDSNRQVARKLGEVIERDRQKQSIGELLSDEMIIRAKLRDVNFDA